MQPTTLLVNEPSMTAETGMWWGVKESLLRYIVAMAHGTITASAEVSATEDGLFRFPVTRVVREDGDWRLSCAGDVRLYGHQGLLDVALVGVELVLGPEGGVLAVASEHAEHGLLAIAALDPAVPEVVDGHLVWGSVRARLAGNATALFGDVYPAGTPLDPLRIIVPAPAEASQLEENDDASGSGSLG